MEMRRIQDTRRRGFALAASIAAAIAIPVASSTATAAASEPVAHAATSCAHSLPPHYRTLGPTYTETLNVSGTSCANGMKVVTAYNRCRLKAGGVKGYCHSKVLGFSCSEKRPQTGPIQFIAKVTCTAGREAVDFTYSENT